MRHRSHGRKLGRTSSHRKAMFRNQLTALFTHERIITTVAKAKDLRPQAERMVTMAKTGTLANRRRILSSIPDADVVRKLFGEIAPRFADRPGGYTRIMRLGRRRGDNAELAIIEFVDFVPSEREDGKGGGKSKPSLMDRAKGMFGGGAKGEGDEVEVAAEPESTAEEPVEEQAVVEPAEVEAVEKVAAEMAAEPEPAVEEAVEEPVEDPTPADEVEVSEEPAEDKKD